MEMTYLKDVAAGRKVALALPVERLPGDWPGDPDQIFELPGYWRTAAEMPDDLRERGTVSREHLWEMADQAAWGERPWTDVMIASFAWGYVNAPYGPFRLRRILTDPANTSGLENSLRVAAGNASIHPITAYHLLRTAPEDGWLPPEVVRPGLLHQVPVRRGRGQRVRLHPRSGAGRRRAHSRRGPEPAARLGLDDGGIRVLPGLP